MRYLCASSPRQFSDSDRYRLHPDKIPAGPSASGLQPIRWGATFPHNADVGF